MHAQCELAMGNSPVLAREVVAPALVFHIARVEARGVAAKVRIWT